MLRVLYDLRPSNDIRFPSFRKLSKGNSNKTVRTFKIMRFILFNCMSPLSRSFSSLQALCAPYHPHFTTATLPTFQDWRPCLSKEWDHLLFPITSLSLILDNLTCTMVQKVRSSRSHQAAVIAHEFASSFSWSAHNSRLCRRDLAAKISYACNDWRLECQQTSTMNIWSETRSRWSFA